jgi:predicted GNAT family acetyltransferase
MEIKQQDDGKKGRFYVEFDSKVEGEMTYVWAGAERIIIDHTEVSEVLKGKNVGKQFVQEAVVFAREKHLKVLPLCPFAKHVFDITPDYNDVLF